MAARDKLLAILAEKIGPAAARSIVDELTTAGYVVVTKSPTEEMLATAMLLGSSKPSEEDRQIAIRAAKLLPCSQKLGAEKERLVTAAAYLAQSYRAMLAGFG